MLGGVTLPHEAGLLGHSDADVLTHAVMDALLGAAALGDIGGHFPNTDARWKDASSIAMLRQVAALVRGGGFDVSNVDATVMAEVPRLAPHIIAMRHCLAEALSIPVDGISVKATTVETMGAIGRREGIAALAIATLNFSH